MGFPEYEGPVIVTHLRPGVIMVRPATEVEVAAAAAKAAPKVDDAAPDEGAGIDPTETPHPYILLRGSGNKCTTCGLVPGADVHDPMKWGHSDVE